MNCSVRSLPCLLALFVYALALSLPAEAAKARAQSAALADLQLDIPHTRFVLNNGLTVVVHEDHTVPLVHVNIWYHVGSKNEPAGKTGFAHLFEHLMFNGSEHFNDDWFKALEPLGATDMNGTTSTDRTNYYQTVPTAALDTLLWLESDRMGWLLGGVDQAKLDEQRGVVQNEKRERAGKAYAIAGALIPAAIWPAAHPYAHELIGSMEDLEAASLQDVHEWFGTWYGPSNAVLVLSGDITAELAKEKVEEYFGAIPRGEPVTRPKAWVAKRTGTQRQTAYDRLADTGMVYRIWNMPGEGVADADHLDMFAGVLGGMFLENKTSRLYKRLVRDEQIATAAYADASISEIAGEFRINVKAKPGVDLVRIEQVIDEELKKLLEDGPTGNELDVLRTARIATYARQQENLAAKASLLASGQVYSGTPNGWKTRIERMKAATPAQLRDAGRRWLTDGDYVLQIFPFDTHAASARDVDRSRMPQPGEIVPPIAPTFERATLSNGLKIMVAERHGIPSVELKLLIRSGYPRDLDAFPVGVGPLTMRLANEGAGERNAVEFAEAVNHLGAMLLASADNEGNSEIYLSALTPAFPQALTLFADMLLRPRFAAADLERHKTQTIVALQGLKVDPAKAAASWGMHFLFGEGHPYARRPTQEGIAALTREDVSRYHRSWIRPNDATLIVVGDTNLADLKPQLERLLANWKPAQRPETVAATMATVAKPTVWLIDQPGAEQSTVIAALPAPAHAKDEEVALTLFNDVLGGGFVSRLNLNLREDKHWSYGASSGLLDKAGVRAFAASAKVQTDRTKESLNEMQREIADIVSSRPVTSEELTAVKKEGTRQLIRQWGTNRPVLRTLERIALHSLEDDYWAKYAQSIEELQPSNMQKIATELIADKPLTWIIAGDLSKIEKGIRELNLGAVKVFDADGKILR